MLCLWHVVSVRCCVCGMLCLWHVVSVTCCVCDMLYLWHVVCVTCCVCGMLCLWHVMSVACCVWHVVYVACCLCDMLFMWHVMSVACCVCGMLFMWHVVSVGCCLCDMLFFLPSGQWPRDEDGDRRCWSRQSAGLQSLPQVSHYLPSVKYLEVVVKSRIWRIAQWLYTSSPVVQTHLDFCGKHSAILCLLWSSFGQFNLDLQSHW